MTEDNEDRLLRSVALQNAESIRIARQRAERQAEATLREQANLLNLTHDCIFVRDMNRAIRYWNRAAEELYGWREEQALGRVVHQLLNTVFPAPLEQIEREIMHAGRWEGELVHTKKDGSQVVVASRWSLQRDERGAPVAILETDNDITERKRAEQARQESEIELRNLIETIPAMAGAILPDGTVTFVNRRWAEYIGLSAEEIAASGWQTAVHPEDLERHLGKWRVSLATGQPFENEVRFRRAADGEYRWFLGRGLPLRDERGNILKWYAILADIEDRKRTEEALRQSERNLAEAQRLAHTASFIWDIRTGRALHVSDEWYRMLGFDPERDVHAWEERLQRMPPDDRAKWQAAVDRAINEKSDYELEYRIVLPNGLMKYLYVIGHPVLNASGDVVQFMGSVTDISERKRAEEELRAAETRFRQLQADLAHINRVTTMGELTASLAHEVNQPIAASVTNASTCVRWLAGEVPNLEEAREAAKRTVKEARRAADIIGRIRLLFKKSPPQHELIDVNDVITEMIALLRSEASRYRVSIRAELAPDLPPVAADRVQLQQVLMNLMVNGMEAMKGVDRGRELTLTSQRDGLEEVRVSVADTGVGLPPEGDQIFNAFFTTKADGTGMGLAISKSIAESHGGRLWATTNSGSGAIFHLTLPTTVGRIDD